MSLRELLGSAADGLPGVAAATMPDGAITWALGGRPFASLSADGTTAEFALDEAVAAAATRTPDAAPADRGPGWVAFSPAVLDDQATDRAVAWFASAHRRLGGRT